MPRRCTVCTHSEREEIDAALVAASDSLRAIAGRFGVSRSSLMRHRDKHLPEALVLAQEAQEIAHADDLVAQMQSLQRRTLKILTKAERGHNIQGTSSIIGQARRNIELLGKLMGELQQEGTVNIVLAPEWMELRTVILAALAPHPDARLAVARALEEGHAGG